MPAAPTSSTNALSRRKALKDVSAISTSTWVLLSSRLAICRMQDVGRERDIYFNMGIAQQQIGNLQNARRHFRQALEIDSNFGAAYIAIGDLYVTQVGNCGSFDREDRAVYWLAVDYYERAASRDPSVASQARQKARSYSGSFPSSEDLFFRGWSVGDTYQVNYGCYSWIGESTTVRRP